MCEKLSDFYFLKALTLAKSANLTDAVMYASISLGLDNERTESRKLAGLCYYKLGNYTMAKYCFGDLPYYLNYMKEPISQKEHEMELIRQLTGKKHYKKAIQILEKNTDKSIGQFNYLGCLYAVMQKKEKAASNFSKALKGDTMNADALFYLRNMEQIKTKRWWTL